LLALLLIWRSRRSRRAVVNVHRDSIPIPMEPRFSDDLTVVKGIGLKSAGALHSAGIYTYADLSRMPVDALREILQAANLRLVDPVSWPEQARALMG
jgi:predicted flap endonuclease-1-like 5' DNA nuclease